MEPAAPGGDLFRRAEAVRLALADPQAIAARIDLRLYLAAEVVGRAGRRRPARRRRSQDHHG